MDGIIHNAIRKGHWDHRLIDLLSTPPGQKLYFFFRQELQVAPVRSGDMQKDWSEFEKLKKTTLRHAVPNKGMIFDYIEGKHYDTLKDWAVANGKSLEDIVYGVNHIHILQNDLIVYCSLHYLLCKLDPSWLRQSDKKPDHDETVKLIKQSLKDAQTLITRAFTLMETLN
jgi:hypothetical protein